MLDVSSLKSPSPVGGAETPLPLSDSPLSPSLSVAHRVRSSVSKTKQKLALGPSCQVISGGVTLGSESKVEKKKAVPACCLSPSASALGSRNG